MTTSTSMRTACVLLSLLIIGALMYFNKDRVPTVADAPKTKCSHAGNHRLRSAR